MRVPVAAALAVLAASTILTSGAGAQTPTPADAAGKPAGKPANLCLELVAFLKQPSPAAQAAAGASAPGGEAKADPKLTTAVQAPKPGDQPVKAAGTGAPSESGISGPINNNAGQGAPGPQGADQKHAQPTAASPTPAIVPAPRSAQGKITLDEAQALADAKDMGGCRDATQKLRRAGTPLPAGLLALGALDPKFYDADAL